MLALLLHAYLLTAQTTVTPVELDADAMCFAAIADFGRTLKNDSALPAASKEKTVDVNNRVMAYFIGVLSRRTDDDLSRQIPAALSEFNKKTSAEKGEFIAKCTAVPAEQVRRTFRPLISGSFPK